MKKILGAESVAIGHPDKAADQVSDAILDAYLAQDPKARVACETVITPNCLLLAGEITSKATVDLKAVAKSVLQDIGYVSKKIGFDASSCEIEMYISQQSEDIARAVNRLGAGDQGLMIGYATDETESFMPLPVVLAHSLMELLRQKRETKEMPFLGPDGKVLVEVAYDGIVPFAIDSIVLSTQHTEDISIDDLRQAVQRLLHEHLPRQFVTSDTRFYINPAGRFVIGGPRADTGMTGRKQMVDTYGGIVRHGGGAFSGKDPTKVDRSAAYLARYIAKNIVAASLAKRCEVALTYVIGLPDPITLQIDTFGSSELSPSVLQKLVSQVFPLDVTSMIQLLNLERPIYRKTAYGGHFGRNDPDFTWERTDKVNELIQALPFIL